MNSLDRLHAAIQTGATLRTLEHTYRPDLVGTTRIITSVGKTIYSFDVVGGRANQRGDFPKRVRDVQWLNHMSVKIALPTRPGHHLTLEVLPAADSVEYAASATPPT